MDPARIAAMKDRDYSGYRRFRYHAGGSAHTRAPRDAVWAVITAIGGSNRYYTMNGLWAIREAMDAIVGGPGLRRERPPADRELRPGDRIDSWEVLAADRPERLALVFGMKAPGRGVLEFRITPTESANRVSATAYWEPDGLPGVLYWRAMQPAHVFLFDRLTSEICRRASAAERADAATDAAAPADAARQVTR
jgi:uncharacterized protein YndB with AHSA1/START domain